MKNKLTVIIATILFFNFAFAQQKGILLSSKIDDETEFYKENKRVKIETNDGKKYTGRIKIIDKKNISIDDEIIAIDTIIKIRSQSLFSALFSATHIILGSVVILASASAGGFAILLIPFGIIDVGIGLSISAIGNNHKKYKWDYEIMIDNQPKD